MEINFPPVSETALKSAEEFSLIKNFFEKNYKWHKLTFHPNTKSFLDFLEELNDYA